MGKTYIYSRVSTDRQTCDNQLHQLRQLYPDAMVVEETVSGKKGPKPLLLAMIMKLQANDTLIIAALDRLGRDLYETLGLIQKLDEKRVKLISLRENIDCSTPAGVFARNQFLSMAQFERDLISERTKTAMAAKKATANETGWRCGRPITVTSDLISAIKAHRAQGLNIKQISALVGVSTATVCRSLKTA